MLENLHIKNLALVTELDVDFGRGLNTVTGETGAGKSLIIGAVQLLIGGRATPSVIRKGEKSCEVTGVICLDDGFKAIRQSIAEKLAAADIPPCEEDRLLIRRVVTESGSRAYVNGTMVTAAFLKEIGENLVDLHGPHDNQTLLKPSKQLELLDTFAGLDGDLQAVSDAYAAHAAVVKELEHLRAEGLAPEEAGLLEYQLKEIDDAELTADEEPELIRKYKLASSSQRLGELAAAAQQELCDSEDSIADRMATQIRALRELEQLDPKRGGEILANLEAVAESIQDVCGQIADYADGIEMDEEAFHELEVRLDLIQKLKRKYGPTLNDVLATAERIRTRLENMRGRAGRLTELAEAEASTMKRLEQLCDVLSAKRNAAAPGLASAIENKLAVLGFQRAAFHISLKRVQPGQNGADEVEFEFSANVGSDLQPLRHVASSGEIARVMLAIKTVLSDADSVPILIFDEIDANVGGRVAVAVAEELRAVGRKHQVFSITHMPQIAAAGQQHYLVAKHVVGDMTTTGMTRIEDDARQNEIVRMLGADGTSEAAVAHARELLGMESHAKAKGKEKGN